METRSTAEDIYDSRHAIGGGGAVEILGQLHYQKRILYEGAQYQN